MKSYCSAILALVLLLAAPGVGQAQLPDHNVIGIFTTETPSSSADARTDVIGSVTMAYAVIMNPYNKNTDTPIEAIGGFEFRVNWPATTFALTSTLHPSSTNFMSPPDFYVGCNVPVVNGMATLVTFSLLNMGPGTAAIDMVSSNPSVPGNIAITDFNDGWSISLAYSSSGTGLLGEPLFGIGQDVIVNIPGIAPPASSWGVDITALGEQITAGATDAATDDYDAGLDLVDSSPNLTFHRPEWAVHGSTDYESDIRADYDPLMGIKAWDFTVNVPDQSGIVTTVELGFEGAGDFDPAWHWQLADNTSGDTVALYPGATYSYDSAGGSRVFTMYVGSEIPLVGFTAGINGLTDSGNVATAAEGATDGYDPGADLPEPGPPPSNYIVASFEHPDWMLGPRFRQDVRAPWDWMNDQRTYAILVETDQAGLVTLDFTYNFSQGGAPGLQIRDLQTDRIHPLQPQLQYTFEADGVQSYRFELGVGGDVAPALEPASRDLAAGWSLVAPPLIPYAGLDSVDDVILDQVPGYGYLFSYEGAAGYASIDGAAATGPGQGYWLATDQRFTWSMEGDYSLDPVTLPLDMGWNLIGNPLWFPGYLPGLKVSNGSTTLGWVEALNANWVTGLVDYSQALDDYVFAESLAAWHGYWAGAEQPGLSLVFDWRDMMVIGAKSGIELPAGEGWNCNLVMDDGSGRLRKATVGVHTAATDGFDARFDQPRPPASPSGGASLALLRPEWDLACGSTLASDIVGENKDGDYLWTARITPRGSGSVVLSWTPDNWPVDLDLELYLPGENRVVVRSMLATESITLPVGNTPLDVVVRTAGGISGVGDDVPFAGYDVAVHPNPFNPSTKISFNLPREGRVDVNVYNVRGELVAILGGSVMQAGRQELDWRGRDREGRSVPSGSYFARVLVDGQPVGATARMSLVR